MAGVALGVNSISSGDYLDQIQSKAKQPLFGDQTGRVRNVLLVDSDGNIRDSLDSRQNPDKTIGYVNIKDISLPPMASAVDLPADGTVLPEGMTPGSRTVAGNPGAFYFPVETEKGRRYVIVVLDSAESFATPLQRQSQRSLLYTLVVLLVTTILTAIVVWSFTRPIKFLSTAARRVARGDFSYRVPATKRRDEMGELTQLFNDMTLQLSRAHELEEQLHQAEKGAVVGRLASAIAHEIRNPLNYINLTLDHLRSSYSPADPDRQEKFIALTIQLKSEVARINTRITEFLNYSRPAKMEPVPTDLYATAKDALRMIEAQASEAGVAIEISGDRPSIVADRESLRSAMTNLIINAFQAIDGAGGKISINLTDEQNGRIRIAVADTGRGIEPEDIAKVFEPYYSTKETGTGLGLAIVKKAVDEHGGAISVTSKPGHGTTFAIVLPVKPPQNTETQKGNLGKASYG